jgi:hypothetical protein
MADQILDWATYVDGDADFRTGPQEALRIRLIGTDKTATLTPQVDGNDLGPIRSEIAHIHETGSNEQGPLALNDLYYYVPPETTVEFDGVGGDTVFLAGEYLDSPAGRFESGADETRFDQQGSYHWTFTQGSTDVSEPISDDQEFVVHTLTPNTDERYEFDGWLQVDHTSGGDLSLTEGDVSYLWDFDGQQRPSQFNDDVYAGIDHTIMPRPPTDSDEQDGFVYGEDVANVEGFVVTGDSTFRVVGRNVSGGALDSSSSNTSTFTFTAAVKFRENL